MITIGIKTFCRPDTLKDSLSILFEGNEEKYPVIIADDSLDKYKEQNLKIINNFKEKFSADIKVIDMPFDSGLSRGRNEIVENCETQYIMIMDDSRTFSSELPVANMINFLEENEDYHLFFGVINSRPGKHRKYAGIFDEVSDDDTIRIKLAEPKIIKHLVTGGKLFENLEETNIGVNVFVARTECLKKVKWNNELKVGEHELFFYNFFKAGYKCVISEDCNFIQVQQGYPEGLKVYRDRGEIGGELDRGKRIILQW